MPKPPATLAQIAKELDYVQIALGDILKNQDKNSRRLRLLLKLGKKIDEQTRTRDKP